MGHFKNAHTFNISQVADIYNWRLRIFQTVAHLGGSIALQASMAAEFSTVAKGAFKIAGALCSEIEFSWKEGLCAATIQLTPLAATMHSWPASEGLMGFKSVPTDEGFMLQKKYLLNAMHCDASTCNEAWQILVSKTSDELFQDLNSQNEKLQDEISQRIAAQSMLEEAQRDLIENEKLKALGGLVAGISHEINTPVGICVTAASHLSEAEERFRELYQSGGMKRSDLESFVQTAKDAVEIIELNLTRASELIRSFKEVAVDQTSEKVREFVLVDYVNQVVLSLRPKLRNRKVQIVLDGIDPAISLKTTPGPISQILVNLITNSLVHAFDDQQAGVISISAQLRADSLSVTYSDNGKGIVPENIDKIFNPFFTTRRSHGGSGLGMHLVHNIVTKIFSGKINCESTVGRGVCFQITLCGVLG